MASVLENRTELREVLGLSIESNDERLALLAGIDAEAVVDDQGIITDIDDGYGPQSYHYVYVERGRIVYRSAEPMGGEQPDTWARALQYGQCEG